MKEYRITHVESIYRVKENLLKICEACEAVNLGKVPCKDPRFFTPQQCVQLFGYNGIPLMNIEYVEDSDPLFKERQFS